MNTQTVANAASKAAIPQGVMIHPPKFKVMTFMIDGTAPYVQIRFSEKAKQAMKAKHEAGSVATKGKKREPRDFNEDYKNAMHVSEEGWIGIPASAFRAACIDACRLVNFKMTLGKLSLFTEADGLDKVDGMPLIKIIGTPEKTEMIVKNETGVADIRVRPMWRKWSAKLRIRFDLDQFSPEDVTNLLNRAGQQVGIGEGRANSKSSYGMGWGFFQIRGTEI
jgi:hypothetical protein